MKKRFLHLLIAGVTFGLLLGLVGAGAGAGIAVSDQTARLSGIETAQKRSSSAIAITADGGLLLVADPDSGSITLVDLIQGQAIAEIPVGIDPRCIGVDGTGQRAYVTNRGSNSVSVIDLQNRKMAAEIPVSDRPYGVIVAPDGKQVYVAEQGVDQITVIDATRLSVKTSFPVPDRPSGLAITADGKTLLVSHLLSGQMSIISLDPQRTYLPLIFTNPPPAGQAGSVEENSARRHQTTPIFPVKTLSLWPDSNLAQSIVLSPDQRYAYLPHTRSNTANKALTFDTTVFPLISIVDLKTQTHLLGKQFDLGTLDPPGVGLPFDAAFSADGQEIWSLNAASNDISVIDLTKRRLAAHIEVGDNPRGIVFSPDGTKVYVNNTLAGTVSVIDAHTYTVSKEITVTQIPLPPAMLVGKRLFHSSDDPRVSLNQWISCNTCHYEGEQDGRTWNFGFSGPRNTTSLMGMIETYPLRWSGEWNESADAEFANRKENFGSGLLAGEMNCSLAPPDCAGSHLANAGRSNDLDSLALFIDSLAAPFSPGHANGAPLSAAEARGRAIFNRAELKCVTCHPAPLYTDLKKHNVGTATADERIGPDYDTPSLRGLYDSAPYFHDGSAATLRDALTRSSAGGEHDVRGKLSDTEISDLIAFLLALPFKE